MEDVSPQDHLRRLTRWQTAPDRALDLGGPTNSFPQLASNFTDLSAVSSFQNVAFRLREKVAVVDSSRRLTYGELLEASDSLAHAIVAAVPDGAAVGILMPASTSYAVAMLGCLAAGRPYVALDSRYPVKRNSEIIEQAGVSVLVVDGAQPCNDVDLLSDLKRLDVASLAAPTEFSRHTPLPNVSTNSPAVILHTSGSTGLAKGIVNNQRSLLQRVLQHVQASHANSEDVFLLLSSLCTIAGTREALTALLTGSRLVIIDQEMAGLRAIRKTIHDQGISILYAVPALISAVIDAATTEDDFRSLRIVRLGGDRVLWSDIAAVRRVVSPGCHIQIGYSSTETTGTQWFVPSRFPESSPIAPVGYVLPGIDFAIVDDGDSPVASGEVGELVIRSRYVALGQWHKGRCACGAITVDPGNPELRIFRTGDLIRNREDGLMEVMGRKDRQIKIHGKRIEPAELEAMLRGSTGVSDAAVIARRLDEQTCLVAFVAPMPGASPCLLSNLGAAIRTDLPAPLHPARLHRLQSIPRLPSAKLDIQALLEADDLLRNFRDGPSRLPDPRDSSAEIRAIVERIWGKLLGKSAITDPRSWDDSGGDSLKLLRFVFELEEALGQDLPLDRFHMSMTVSHFASTIEDVLNSPSSVAKNDDRPTFFLLPGLSGDNPGLASFRAELHQSLHFVSIDYPEWRDMVADRCTIESLAEEALQQIIKAAPVGDIRLASYSFGGAVALVAAERLIQLGRCVSFFAVFDTNISGATDHVGQGRLPTLQEIQRTSMRVLRGSDSFHARMWQLIARRLVAASQRTMLRRLARRELSWLPAGSRFALQKELSEALRWQAFQKWMRNRPKIRLSGRVALFRSQEDRREAPPDLGWGNHFDVVDIVNVGGDHLDMFREPHRTELGSRFTEVFGSRQGKEKSDFSSTSPKSRQ